MGKYFRDGSVKIGADGIVDFHRFDIAEHIATLDLVTYLAWSLLTVLSEEELSGNRRRYTLGRTGCRRGGRGLACRRGSPVIRNIQFVELPVEVYSDASLTVIPGAGHGFEDKDSKNARDISIAFIMAHLVICP